MSFPIQLSTQMALSPDQTQSFPHSLNSMSTSTVASSIFKPNPPEIFSIRNLTEDVRVHMIHPYLDLRGLLIFAESMNEFSTLKNSIWKSIGVQFGLSFSEIEVNLTETFSAENYVKEHLMKLVLRENRRRSHFKRIDELLKCIEANPNHILLYQDLYEHAEALNYRIFFNHLSDHPIDLQSDTDTLRNAKLSLKIEISEVTKLKLYRSHLTQLPKEIELFKNLVTLNLSTNFLTELPSLSSCQALQNLYCEKNKLQFLPDLSSLPLLIELDCHNNELKKLPHLPNLKILECRNNSLTSLDEIENLKSLEELYCRSNSLTHLPPLKFPNLKKLYCDHNLIRSLTEIELPELRLLDVSENLLTHIASLTSCKSLRTFNCSHNQLESLPDLSDLSLETVNCAFNPLSFATIIQILKKANDGLIDLKGF